VAFVVTAGQLQQVQRTPNWWGASTPHVQLSPALTMTYQALWRAQPALRTVVSFLARNVASLGLDPYRRGANNDRSKLTDHPLAQLLERPVPGTKWTKYRLLNTLMQDLCIFDDAYLLKMRLEGGVRAIQPMPNRFITPIGDNPFAPDGYRIVGNRGTREVSPDQVVHIHGYNPDDPRRGTSPIETLRQILAEEYAASVYREQMWRNGARVAGYIKRPLDAPKWSDATRDRFRNDWQAQYAGSGPETGGTPVLEEGMEFLNAGVTPRDAQYVEARKLTREEVAVAYHVSPVMIGLMDGATFSNVTELHKMLYQDTLAPYLVQLAQDLECQLLADLDPVAAKSGSVYVEFNLAEKLRGSFAEQSSAMQSAVGGPWMSRAEARAMYNLPHVDGSDELIVPLNVLTGALASPNDTAPDNPSNEASNGQPPKARDVLRALYERQQNSILSRLGGSNHPPAADVFDVDRWACDMVKNLGPFSTEPADLAAMAARVNTDILAALHRALQADNPKLAVREIFATLTQGLES